MHNLCHFAGTLSSNKSDSHMLAYFISSNFLLSWLYLSQHHTCAQVLVPKRLLFKYARETICFAITGLVGGGAVSGVRQVYICSVNSLSSSKPATQRDEIKHLPFISFQRQNGRSDLPSFFMDRCPKNEATAKNFVWNKSSSHSHEN